jgi:hypothetical protein
MHEIAVRLYRGAWILVIEAGAKILLAAQAVAVRPHVVRSLRVLVAEPSTDLADAARLHRGNVEDSFLQGADL